MPSYLSINEFPGDGVTTQHEFSFAGGYIDKSHVKASIYDALGAQTSIAITELMWIGPYILDLGVAAPVGGHTRIYRDTPREEPLADFADRARLREANLDLLARQAIFVGAEAFDAGAYAEVNDLLGQAAASAAAALSSASGAVGAAGAASAHAADADAAAALAAGFAASLNPALYVPLVGATMTGHLIVPSGATGSQAPRRADVVGSSGDENIDGVKTFTSSPVVPANATGQEAPRAEETVRVVGGAARIPTWAIGDRPASPSAGDSGFNTTLGCHESWDGTYWVPEGWQTGAAVAMSGTSAALTGIPAWANEVKLFVRSASHNSGTNQGITFQLGSAVAGYIGACDHNGTAVAWSTTARIPATASAASVLSLVVDLQRVGSVWQVSVSGNYSSGTYLIGTGTCPLDAPLTSITWAWTAGSTDAGETQLSWRK